jgi:alpha-L-rhamnosidase|uniref:family 78 glycoside hydrolase catalytic domain n=1 Tax=Cephaloticoccus sp. TaxID=1985742 RepID=UPI004048F8B0
MASPTRPVQLRCNHLTNPLGLHDQVPALSWRLATDGHRGARQNAYRIHVSTKRTGAADLWDSGWINSAKSNDIAYAGHQLKSRSRAWWRIEIRDERNQTATSALAFWEMGLLAPEEWQGAWIGSALAGGPDSAVPSPYLRTMFNVNSKIARARLYVTALGLYEFQINGQRIGRDEFTPGWTDYAKRVQYQVYDITDQLHHGANAAGAILGDGWYCGRVGWRNRAYYGDRPKLMAQIVITYRDGSEQIVATNEAWKTACGAIVENDFMHGETHDARRELTGWSHTKYDDRTWLPVTTFSKPTIEISPTLGTTVQNTQQIKPIGEPNKIEAWPDPVWIFDLGQNIAGRVCLQVKGRAGQIIRIRYAEVINADGSIYTDNLRAARVTDYYILRGNPAGESWEPKFTFHGFRYVEVGGHPETLTAEAITGIVLHNDIPRTGDFSCSDPLINQLQRNIDWGQRGNFLEVPTDCPQRNERLGWMGDAQVFIRTAAWNRDVASFFTKWQRDIDDAQQPDGAMPAVVPHINGVPPDGGPAWADAAVICPWTIYLCYGDKALLARHFAPLEKFVNYMEKNSTALIRSHPDAKVWHGFGDWLALDGSGNVFGNTPKDLIGTAMFCYSTDLLAKIARVLDREPQAVRLEKLANRIRRAYQKRFVTDNGVVTGLTQTSYVLTLHFDLAPESLRPKLMGELVRDIVQRGHKLSTGFVGASYMPHVLSRFGRLDIAYKLLHQKAWPSWLYAVTQGATTIWERWDGWTKENGFQDKGMNSFNHYAYGAIGCWLYQVVAGIEIDPAQPAYKHILLAPKPGGELTRARGRLQSIHGEIISSWKLGTNRFDWAVTVPPNTTATATFPVSAQAKITEGGKSLSQAVGVTPTTAGKRSPSYQLTSGHYKFKAIWR